MQKTAFEQICEMAAEKDKLVAAGDISGAINMAFNMGRCWESRKYKNGVLTIKRIDQLSTIG
jgi:hypothetical protein